jgi:heme exporter protein B
MANGRLCNWERNMPRSLLTIIQHEIRITVREASSWITPLIFFIIVVCLFPLALGPVESLNQMAPGIIWVAALLAIVMSMGTLFQRDAEEGHLDVLILSPTPLTLLVLCKVISHWITHCLPLIVISPILGLLLHLNTRVEITLIITLLLGTPVLTLLGAIGAALVTGIRGQGLLLPVLIMPLYIPVLIFGTGALMAANNNQPFTGHLALLAALTLITVTFAPFLTGAALRIGVNE